MNKNELELYANVKRIAIALEASNRINKKLIKQSEEIWKKINADIDQEPDMETLMTVGILLMSQSKSCGIEWK